jgi:hypothetical protein
MSQLRNRVLLGLALVSVATIGVTATIATATCWSETVGDNSCTKTIAAHHDPSCETAPIYAPVIISSLPCESVFETSQGYLLAVSLTPARACSVEVSERNEFGACMRITHHTTEICQDAFGDACDDDPE